MNGNKWNGLNREQKRIEMVVGTYKLANNKKKHDALDSGRWRQ